MIDLKPGDRVHLKGHWNWPSDCFGTVRDAAALAQAISSDNPWRGHIRSTRGRAGIITSVWVVFDEPQKDGDGDGPYSAGEVEVEFVTRVDQPTRG